MYEMYVFLHCMFISIFICMYIKSHTFSNPTLQRLLWFSHFWICNSVFQQWEIWLPLSLGHLLTWCSSCLWPVPAARILPCCCCRCSRPAGLSSSTLAVTPPVSTSSSVSPSYSFRIETSTRVWGEQEVKEEEVCSIFFMKVSTA